MTKLEIEEKPKIFEEDIKPKRRRREVSSDVVLEKQYKRTLLCVSKPSYLLSLGSKSHRIEFLSELPRILSELLSQRNWNDASRVLSVLTQGTMRDCSPKMNRLKYQAQIQIVSHLKPDKRKAEEIGNIYDTWIGKIGKQHKEERLLVWFEQICHFIEHGMNGDAYSAVISLMQNRDFGMLPRSNLFIGITFFKLWRCKFLKELQREDEDCDESVSNMSESRSDNLVENSVRDESVYSVESEGSVRDESESSVMNGKRVSHMSISDSRSGMVMKKVKLESSQHYTNPSQLYATSGESDVSVHDGARTFDATLVKILGDMDPWLLPLKPPEDSDCYVKMVNDSYYKEAVRYLRRTLQSPHYVSLAALHPLIQLLLIGGHVDEAMKVVQEMCKKVHDIKPFRIKALMMERFHPNSNMLAKSYEDILRIDPTCVTTLKKLIDMWKEDGYSRESLIEMIALHVEASFPDPEIWEEFASCFIHFFDNLDEDRMSVCLNGDGEEHNQQQTYSVRYNPTPKMFTNSSWTLRAKWWLNRHFSHEMLESEIKKTENGDLEMMKMMSYKAACASHIYGREFGYVTRVYDHLENNSDYRDLFNFLQEHRQNWNMIYNLD
ncbi:hypothetical protein AALP_AA4G030100 [Arabis alpina]|uniref:Uncharacterized protein n=1 Tax=Arabis alpina TaxID=50452 RepID=A0A087H0T6_ARAAL|nr:hypothetical protein AALP_AA4G030100 [Arabis alpina]